jgi:hypothetical protein
MSVLHSPFGLRSGLLRGALSNVYSSNFKSFLDPGDAACYPSHPTQTIVDLAPAAADNWWLGPDGTTTRDPSFSGTAGAQTDEHWVVQNTNQEIKAKTAIPVYRDFVKTGSTSSFALMAKFDNFGATDNFFSTVSSLLDTDGFYLYPSSADSFIHFVHNGNGVTSSNTVSTAAWIFIGVTYDQPGGANASFLNVNGTVTTFTASTNTTNPTSNARFFITRTGTNRVGPSAAWDTALSQGEMEYVREQMTRRYV